MTHVLRLFYVALAAATLGLSTGCFFGPSSSEIAAARQAYGSLATVANAKGRYRMVPTTSQLTVRGDTTHRVTGELIAVRDGGWVLLVDAGSDDAVLVYAPYGAFEEGHIEGLGHLGDVDIDGGGRPSSSILAKRVRQLSRYPYGLTPEAEARMLTRLGQSEIIELRQEQE
jgi:hypothetical protein